MALPIQIILIRQLAGYLSVPLLLVDPKGDLLFYNEPAEAMLGRRFEETGPLPAKTWAMALTPVDEEGRPIPPEDLPLMIALTTQRPAYRRLYIHGLNGVRRHLATPVARVMTPEVVTVGPDDDVEDLVDLMLENRVGAVPVVEGAAGRVVGIVSYVDLLRAFRDRLQ